MATSGALSARKSKAIAALLSSKTVLEAAELSNIGARTLTRWLAEPEFQAELANAEGEILDNAIRRLTSLSNDAVQVLADSLGPEVPGYVRLKAAGNVLDYVLRLRELRGLEKRLAQLEEVLNNG